MSLGLCLLRRCAEDGLSPDQIFQKGLEKSDFTEGDEQKVFQYYVSHYRRFKAAPSSDTITTETDVVLPEVPEKHSYYLERMQQRKILAIVRKCRIQLKTAVDNLDFDAITRASERLRSNLNSVRFNDPTTLLSQGRAELFREYEERLKGGDHGDVSTGFPYFDEITGGIQRTDFVVISGRPGLGKSWLMIYAALLALLSGKRVLFITLEMPSKQIKRRIWSILARMSYLRYKKGRLTHFTKQRWRKTMVKYATIAKNMVILKGGLNTTVETVMAMVETHDPDVLYVDGAYILKSVIRFDSNTSKIAHVTEALRAAALDYDIPVFASYQMNRQTPKAGGSTETIYGSDVPGQLATIGWSISDDDSSSGLHDSVVYRKAHLFKGRDGERGATIRFGFDTERTRLFQHEVLSHSESDRQPTSTMQEVANPEGTL